MSKKKVKSSQTKKTSNHAFKGKLSIVIPCYNESKRLAKLLKALKNFDQTWTNDLEIILVDDGSQDDTAAQIQQTFPNSFSSSVNFELVKMEQNGGKGRALQEGVSKASGDYILTMDADVATHPKEIRKWLTELPGKTFDEQQILIGSREHQQSKVSGKGIRRLAGVIFNFVIQLFTNLNLTDTQCGFKLYPAKWAKPLFADLKTMGWAHDVELLYAAQMKRLDIKSMPVKWDHQEDSKISLFGDSIKMFWETVRISARLNWNYFVVQPIKDLGSKSAQPTGESSIFRFLFVALAFALLIGMPMLSFDYGITGDEEIQKIYGEKVLGYFESNDKSALDYKNLYYYGGMFDYWAAKANRFFESADDYEVRHVLNALVGFILMLFTGFLAKEITGSWRAAFFGLLFIALTPRIFGHSMNNPKDIPFAAAYAFTLLYLIRFTKQLPRPSTKTIVFLILGIAAAINVRVGGILLIAYTGLFTGLTYLGRTDLRPEMTNFPHLLKTAGTVLIVAVLGYFLGLLYWPYALQAPLSNPFVSLSEMSNFSTSIRMLFEGEHLWSDELPWYYIPKWLWISLPIFLLLGLALFVGFYFYRFNLAKRLPITLLAFTAIFPISYAIYKESLLYDGMRHFLFVVPVIAVLAAWAWNKLIDLQPSGPVRLGSSAVLGALLILPAMWMFKSHPYQYVYFNELSGGLEKAYGKYETDYWMNSIKGMCDWLIEHDERFKNGQEVTVRTNCYAPLRHYMEQKAPHAKIGYVRYNDRSRYATDYFMFISRFVDKGFINSGNFPPPNLIYEEKIGNTLVGSISTRMASHEVEAFQQEKQGNFAEAARLYEAQVKADPTNEGALVGMIKTNQRLQNLPKMKEAVDQLNGLSDSYADGQFYKGLYSFMSNQPNEAKAGFQKAIDLNIKYTPAYYYLALIFNQEKNTGEALAAIESFAEKGGTIPNAFDLGMQLANQSGNQALALYFKSKKLLKSNAQESYNALQESLRLNKNYQPAIELNEAFQKAIKNRK